MLVYIARKLLQTVPVLLGVWTLVFVLFHYVGGDPAYVLLGRHATAQQVAELRAQEGYDLPFYQQYGRDIGQALKFDFGVSRVTHQPIRNMILNGIGPSLTIMLPSFCVMTALAVAIGLFAAFLRNSRGPLFLWMDRSIVILSVLGMSIAMLAFILFGQYVLAYRMGWFPISGYEAEWPDRLRYTALPMLIWIVVNLGYDVRYYRTAFLEEAVQDYVRTARAKGLSETRIYSKHVLKNGIVPVLTNVVLQIPMLILGSFLLEDFFSIPGLGGITIDAIRNSDLAVIQAMTTVGSMLFIAGTLATDILYAAFDPRVRLR